MLARPTSASPAKRRPGGSWRRGRLSATPAARIAAPSATQRPSALRRLGCGSALKTEMMITERAKMPHSRRTGVRWSPSGRHGRSAGSFMALTVGIAGAPVMGARVEAPPPTGGDAGSARAPMTGAPPSPILCSMITNSLEVAAGEATLREEPAVQVRGLRKSYGELEALRGVDLTVRRGEVLALLGPNGAGKTTLVEILEGHRMADAGEVSVLGHDPARRERGFRERIGIVLQQGGLDATITVREAVELYSAAYPRPRPADEVIELVGLSAKADDRAKTLSGGQRRRLDLALGIAGDPELIFLDEPTTGFDPAARRQSWELISGLRRLGKSILLTTHYMDEAQQLADRVVVIARGRIIAEGTPDTLGRDQATIVAFRLPEGADAPLPAGAEIDRGHVRLRTATPTRDLAPLLAWAADRGLELEGLTVTRPTLEDVYLQLTEEPS